MKSYGLKLSEGSTFKNLVVASGDQQPENPDVGELFWLNGTGMMYYDGSSWNPLDYLASRKIEYYTVTTDADSIWTVPLTGFSQVGHVSATAVKDGVDVQNIATATVGSVSTTEVSGLVVSSARIPLGGQGWSLAGPGITVMVRVEGTKE